MNSDNANAHDNLDILDPTGVPPVPPEAHQRADGVQASAEGDGELLLVDDAEFFAPAATDAIASLLSEHRYMSKKIGEISDFIGAEMHGAMAYFFDGNENGRSRLSASDVDRIFNVWGARKSLDAEFWAKALRLTDVYEYMPQARRDAWTQQMTAWRERGYKEGANPEHDLAAFDEDTVRPTIAALLAARAQFLAEKVDGIFRGLSGHHVTNAPEGFGKRMIVERALTYYDTVEHSTAGRIHDLRCVIAKFMGRDEPKHYATSDVISKLRCHYGEWMALDGGALRVKLFKKRTAHIEVHPLMAYRLNQVLASIYPAAIPAKFRTKPARVPKEFALLRRPLPFAVLSLLQEGSMRHEKRFVMPMAARSDRGAESQAAEVLRSIGGVETRKGSGIFEFDYVPTSVLREIILFGVVPEDKSHQFYPTSERLAAEAVMAACIEEGQSVLEPSAGNGDLAQFLPPTTTCVEVSEVRAAVLKAKGYETHAADFLLWAPAQEAKGKTWDRVVMNPPFSEGRAELHVLAASRLVADQGCLVAILPASLKGRDILTGWDHDWSEVLRDEFAGTTVAVAILTATRATLREGGR